jgi:transposase-like protein
MVRLLAEAGINSGQIACEVGCEPRTVRKWKKRFVHW